VREDQAADAGPVPARPPGPPPPGADVPVTGGEDEGLRFVLDDTTWVARVAGEGRYGTGGKGGARLVAVQFFRADAPAEPVREVLMPAAGFPFLRGEELREAWRRATPMDPRR
jgi:hypothetical protein